eukprot:scaffold91_cov173-Amphora_coffeaeformis.AAC.1
MDDPFAVFDDVDDDDDDTDDDEEQDTPSASITTTTATTIITRQAANGPMSYHLGIEQALLQYVKNRLDAATTAAAAAAAAGGGIDATLSSSATPRPRPPPPPREKTAVMILGWMDEFCYQRHWMMHVGPEKGALLDDFLRQSLQRYKQETANHSENNNNKPFVLLELGTYCGYSALCMLQIMDRVLNQCQEEGGDNDSSPSLRFPFHIISIDVNPSYQAVARQLIDLAGWSDRVHFRLLTSTETTDDQ